MPRYRRARLRARRASRGIARPARRRGAGGAAQMMPRTERRAVGASRTLEMSPHRAEHGAEEPGHVARGGEEEAGHLALAARGRPGPPRGAAPRPPRPTRPRPRGRGPRRAAAGAGSRRAPASRRGVPVPRTRLRAPETIGVRFAYATNGHDVVEFDFSTGLEKQARLPDTGRARAALPRRQQEARHDADYNRGRDLTRHETLDLVRSMNHDVLRTLSEWPRRKELVARHARWGPCRGTPPRGALTAASRPGAPRPRATSRPSSASGAWRRRAPRARRAPG